MKGHFAKIDRRLSIPWLALSLIVCMAVVSYGNIYEAPFVFDGKYSIAENLSFQDAKEYLTLKRFFVPRSLVDATFALNYELGKLKVFGYHLFNVLIHALNGVLVYFLVSMILGRMSHLTQCISRTLRKGAISSLAVFSALIFVAHPIQTQGVTYTIQRYTSVAALFFMAAVFFYLHAGATRDKSYYILVFAFGCLAVLSKQNAATLPGVILWAEYLLIDATWRSWKKKLPWMMLWLAVWIIFLLFICGYFSEEMNNNDYFEGISTRLMENSEGDRWDYLCTQFNVLIIYIKLLFFPFQQNLDYGYPIKNGFWSGYTPLAFLLLSGIIGAGIRQIKKTPLIALGIFWIFTTLSVESSIIPIRDPLFEHRLYLPLFGFSLLLASIPSVLLARKRFWTNALISVCLILMLGVATCRRNMVWCDPIRLWADVMLKSPGNEMGYYNLAYYLRERGEAQEAIWVLKRAIHSGIHSSWLHNSLGVCYKDLGILDKAAQEYQLAKKLERDYSHPYNNLCSVLILRGRHDLAVEECREAIRLSPNYYEAHNNLGNAYLSLGRYPEALHEFQVALGLMPERYRRSHLHGIHYQIGNIYFHQGLFKEAEDEWGVALKLRPGFSPAKTALQQLRERRETP